MTDLNDLSRNLNWKHWTQILYDSKLTLNPQKLRTEAFHRWVNMIWLRRAVTQLARSHELRMGHHPPSNIQTDQTAQGRGKYWSRCVASWAPFFSLRIESAEARRPYSGYIYWFCQLWILNVLGFCTIYECTWVFFHLWMYHGFLPFMNVLLFSTIYGRTKVVHCTLNMRWLIVHGDCFSFSSYALNHRMPVYEMTVKHSKLKNVESRVMLSNPFCMICNRTLTSCLSWDKVHICQKCHLPLAP